MDKKASLGLLIGAAAVLAFSSAAMVGAAGYGYGYGGYGYGFTITSTVEGDGAVSPLGSVFVNAGGSQNFVFTDGSQQLVEVKVDGVDIGNPANYSFTGVDADHTIHARFASNGGGGGSSGGGGGNKNKDDDGEVLGESTDGPKTNPDGTCIPLLHTYMRQGSMTNDVQEVIDLQNFLNKEMNAGLPVTGFFGPLTDAAVRAFQIKYKSEVLDPWVKFGLTDQSTGYVFKTTQWKINNIYCAPISFPMPPLP